MYNFTKYTTFSQKMIISIKLVIIAFMFTFILLFSLKLYRMYGYLKVVQSCADEISVEKIKLDQNFKELVTELTANNQLPPFIMISNQFALKMLLNWCCNTKEMAQVHHNTIVVALDQETSDMIRRVWPNIRVLYFPVACLKNPFTELDPGYQLVFLFRANLALALIQSGISFWMVQQDTFWRKNIIKLRIDQRRDFDVLFDQLGYDPYLPRRQIINGANFLVKPTNESKKLFSKISYLMSNYFVLDNGLFLYYCQTEKNLRCAYSPYSVIAGFEWIYGGQKDPPYLIQIDGESDHSVKDDQMNLYGFYFVRNETCNMSAAKTAQKMMSESRVPTPAMSSSKRTYSFFLKLADFTLRIPVLGKYLKRYLVMFGNIFFRGNHSYFF